MSFRNVAREATPGREAITLLASLFAPGKRSISVEFRVFKDTGDSIFLINGFAFTTTSCCSKIISSNAKSKETERAFVTVISLI